MFLLFVLGKAGLDEAEGFKYERRHFIGATALPENFNILVEAPLFLEDLFPFFMVTIMLPMNLWGCLMSYDQII